MLMPRLENEPEEEEPKTTELRRRLELGNAAGAGGAEDGSTEEEARQFVYLHT